MKIVLLIFSILAFSNVSFADSGIRTCQDKKLFLRDICKDQSLNGKTVVFSKCANGYSYEISTGEVEVDTGLVTSDMSCKMVEIRQQDGIEKRTAYHGSANQKVVIYQHDNGLNNAYVYGQTGFYHITEFATGDSVFNFHSFEN